MLTAASVVRRYGRGPTAVTVLDGVDLSVAPGERVAVCGPSGSGKSTLARVLALLERPDAGKVVLDGEAVADAGLGLPRELRLRVALLWQSPRLAADPRLSVGTLVGEPLRSGGRRHRPGPAELDRRVNDVCARVGLRPELVERFPHEVSEGQLQRACLARALISRPSYLICDELTSMLDVSTQAALLEAIAEDIRERDTGVLLVTHDRLLAEHWCERIVELPVPAAAGRPGPHRRQGGRIDFFAQIEAHGDRSERSCCGCYAQHADPPITVTAHRSTCIAVRTTYEFLRGLARRAGTGSCR